MRRYRAEFQRHGTNSQPDGWDRAFTSTAKIGVVVRVLFRKWFGRSPDRFIWHKDGQIASAEDRRGNYVFVSQYNGYMGWPQDLTRLALPYNESEAAQ